MILKLAIGRPLHADQLGSEDSESRVPQRDNGPGIGDGIVEALFLSMLGGG
jgi:nitrogen-specific signal transduction histidine kinase